ncbi:MAG: hypothetical protein LBH04_09010 [Tannerellaceae bacterium]|jgi:hypothetical protein|nr:hypothetical protein [Tannerellaceae bacterium]
MLDFILVPLVVGICVSGVYSLFALFVQRRERLLIIEKLIEKFDGTALSGKINLPSFGPQISFIGLKAGCLLTGIGLGLLFGFMLNASLWSTGIYNFGNTNHYDHVVRRLPEVAYGASVLLFGGIGLLIAFILERKISNKKEEKQ